MSGVLAAVVSSAVALARRGELVELWQPHPWPERGFEQYRADLDEVGVERVVLSTKVTSRPWLAPRMARTAAARRVDVVHMHSVFSPHLDYLARVLTVPYVVSPHGGYSPQALQRRRLQKAAYMRAIESRRLSRAAAIVALTEAEAADLLQLGVRPPIAVVPNGIEPPPPGSDGMAFRADLGLTRDALLAVYAGRLDIVHKGLDRLIQEFADTKDWHLALVGPDDRGGEDYLKAQIQERGLAGRAHLAGSRQGRGLHDALAAADVYTLLSRWEGLPLSLLEAMSHGVPAVVSPAVDQTVDVAGKGAGWVVEAGALADGLNAAMERDERQRRGEAARALASSYAWDSVAQDLTSMYARVCREVPTG
jgi:glycosyltransferase involved in cell wall biosynthesis